jgi:hypothetical protein
MNKQYQSYYATLERGTRDGYNVTDEEHGSNVALEIPGQFLYRSFSEDHPYTQRLLAGETIRFAYRNGKLVEVAGK